VGLVAAAGGVWFFTRGDSAGGPATPAAKDYDAGVQALGAAEVAWRVSQGPAPEAIATEDFWVTEKNLVRRLPGRVVAYDLKTGDPAWDFALDGPSEDRCRSSREQSGNRVALLRVTGSAELSAPCNKLTVLDIATGKEVFTTELPGDSNEAPRTKEEAREPQASSGFEAPDIVAVPVVFGERVVISGDHVYDLGSGAALSTPLADGECKVRTAGLFGDLLLADSLCAAGERGDSDDAPRLRAFDAGLRPVWEWTPPPGEDGKPAPVLGVLSADPLVVEVGHHGQLNQLLRVDVPSGDTVPFSAYGKSRDAFMYACDGRALGSCGAAKVVDGQVILMTPLRQVNPDDPEASPGMQATEFRNELVAYAADTGEESWRTGVVDGRALSIVPTEDERLVAFQPANPNGTKGIVFSVDPATGKLAPLLPIGPDAHADEALFNHVRAFRFGVDSHQAVLREGLFIIFRTTFRPANQGDVETVAFALPA
jgi:outer membrane protein assembly factor BamB